ncbi:hypothetical protein SAV31267_098800 [Streptomyces avermitilis]|uniref:Uncharacterized protein n=1 Tax=Streptomyces avermitilis TaxID=33903 RepID=A0A4D4NA98_STRAX|nr:hypothetical protein SAV31267_098800 [Streptomyces avermitilis]
MTKAVTVAFIRHPPPGALRPRLRAPRAELLQQERGPDHPDVAVRLREVSQLPSGDVVVLLGEQAEVGAQGQEPAEETVGLAGRPVRASASTIHNEQSRKAPSSPSRPSSPA